MLWWTIGLVVNLLYFCRWVVDDDDIGLSRWDAKVEEEIFQRVSLAFICGDSNRQSARDEVVAELFQAWAVR